MVVVHIAVPHTCGKTIIVHSPSVIWEDGLLIAKELLIEYPGSVITVVDDSPSHSALYWNFN